MPRDGIGPSTVGAQLTSVDLRPIAMGDRERVARFLQANMETVLPLRAWELAVGSRWSAMAPNAGFMLVDEEEVVGAYLAYYSEREVGGSTERVCNLGSWSVLPEYRLYGLRLMKALLAQDGYHVTDLTPSERVVALNERLGFRPLDRVARLVPSLPWPSRPGRGDRVTSDPAALDSVLEGPVRQIYRDHGQTEAALHVLLERSGRTCYVVARRDRRKRLPVLTVLYVSDPELFDSMAGPFGRHVLAHFRAVAYVVERQVTDHRPRISFALEAQQRMFKSDRLEADQIDYLYSELVCLAW
jgi:hypothetical protein